MTHQANLPKAFKAHPADTVATMLDDTPAGVVQILDSEGMSAELQAAEPVARGHKIALAHMKPGEQIVKFGTSIGTAACGIEAGAWVHLHNAASAFDERSSTLDLYTGAPSDTRYA